MTAAIITPAFRTSPAQPFRPATVPTGALRRAGGMVVAATLLAALLPVAVELSSSESSESSVFHPQSDASPKTSVSASKALAGLAPRFEVNAGQFDPAVRYVSRGSGYTLFLTSTEAVMDLAATAKDNDSQPGRQLVRMGFAGANATPVIEATKPTAGVTNYLKGNDPTKWTTSVQSFSRITYRSLYPGIDLVYRGNKDKQLEYDFVVAPGADPNLISLTFSGSENLSVGGDADLVVTTAAGELRQKKLFAYQQVAGTRRPIAAKFVVDGGQVRFDLGSYDRARPLVIDPVIAYSTYLGGSGADRATGVARDADGDIYVTGNTCSQDFPVVGTESTAPTAVHGVPDCDAYVMKFGDEGRRLVYATYMGGTKPTAPPRMEVVPGNAGGCPSLFTACHMIVSRTFVNPEHRYPNLGADVATGLAVDAEGRAHVTGYTHSGNFPITKNTAYDTDCGSPPDVPIPGVTLPDGSPVPATGDCETYFVAQYRIGALDVPAVAIQYSNPSMWMEVHYAPDAFLTKLSQDGSKLDYSTYLGAGRDPSAALHPPGEPHYRCGILGPETTPAANGPTPCWGPDPRTWWQVNGANADTRWFPEFTSGGDVARGIALDSAGDAYVTGSTSSLDDFPTTPNAHDKKCGDDASPSTNCLHDPDGFVAKVNTKLSGTASLAYSTYLGGTGRDEPTAIAVAEDLVSGRPKAFVTGAVPSVSGPGSFPTTPGAFQTIGGKAFLAMIDGNPARLTGSSSGFAPSLIRSTHLGPPPQHGGIIFTVSALTVDRSGTPYLAGTVGMNPDFTPPKAPTVTPPLKTEPAAGYEAFVMKLDHELSKVDYFTYLGGNEAERANAIAVDHLGNAYVVGGTSSSTFPTTENAFAPANAGTCASPTTCENDAFVAMLDAKGSSLLFSSYLGGRGEASVSGTGHDEASAIALGEEGQIYVVGNTSSRSFPVTTDAYGRRGGSGDAFFTVLSTTVGAVAGLHPSKGPSVGGTSVLITGTGFSRATSVRFGAVSVPFDFLSDTEIEVTSPAHPDPTVPVTVLTDQGTLPSTNSSSSFTYEEGLWSPAAQVEVGPGHSRHTATLLDHPQCRNPPVSFDYPCGKILVAGGVSAAPFLRLYDPKQGSWSSTAEPPAALVLASPAVNTATLLHDGRVMVKVGQVTAIYNPRGGAPAASGSWTRSGDALIAKTNTVKQTAVLLTGPGCGLPEPRTYCGNVLAFGGHATAEIYDPDEDDVRPAANGQTETREGRWMLTTPPPETIGEAATATVLDGPECDGAAPPAHCGKVLIVGPTSGVDPRPVGLLYDPETQQWVADPPPLTHSGHTATLLPDGKVLIAGGTASADSEVYDPGAALGSRWRGTARMSTAHGGHGAALLPNGKVLIAGASVDGKVTDIYVPGDAGSWRLGRPLSNAHAQPGLTATVLSSRADRFETAENVCGTNCGKVLVIGNGGAELYTAAPSVSAITPDSVEAASNTEVEMTGTGLSGGVALFDRRAATSTFSSFSSLRVVPPAIGSSVRPELWVANEGGPARVSPPFRYTGAPGGVGQLAFGTTPDDKLELSFSAAGSVADARPHATAYQLRRSPNSISSPAEFEAADTLTCASSTPAGDCLLEPTEVGQRLSVTIGPPPAGRTRHYAVRAVNDDGEVGPFSVASYASPGNVVDEVPTTAIDPPPLPERCPAVNPGAGQLIYPAGYSLVGLPPGTVVGANSPLYSWLNQGAGGNYTTAGASAPTEAGRGYWAWFSCPKLVQLGGAGADSVALPLGAYRASMVGNPSGAGSATATGHDFAARWDPNLNAGAGGYHISGYRQAQELAVGQGMWAFSYVPTELSIRRR